MPQPRKVTLDQLSDEDRAQLEAQVAAKLRSDTITAIEEQGELARERDQRISALMDDRDHLRGCPIGNGVQPPSGRVECYPQTKPARPNEGRPARPVTVVRCQECGGATVLDRPFDGVLLEITPEAAVATP